MKNPRDKSIREPIVEGIFYPADKEELSQKISQYISGKERGAAPLILSPHGGYSAVGELIGHAFAAAADRKIETVVIISPVHREEQEHIILPRFKTFKTIAGELPVDMKALHLFAGQSKAVIRDDIPHMEEHSIEDQLPFISTLFPQAQILPILLGKTTISLVKKLTEGLKRAFGDELDRVLFVVTSNLSEYGKREEVLNQAKKSLELFASGDWRNLCEEKRTGGIEACGAGALASVLSLYESSLSMKILQRSEPENRESEKGKTVAYGSLAFEEEN